LLFGLFGEPVKEGFVSGEGHAFFLQGFALVDVDDVLTAAVGVVVFHLVVRHAKCDCAYGFDTVLIEVTHDDSFMGWVKVMKKNYEGFGYDARGCYSF
jgi:hypothetical protein